MTNPNPNSTSYGLNIRPKKDTGVDKKATNNNVALELKLLEKFREDIKKFPDDKGLEEFIGVPVNGYGKAVLAGYGWYRERDWEECERDVKVVQDRGVFEVLVSSLASNNAMTMKLVGVLMKLNNETKCRSSLRTALLFMAPSPGRYRVKPKKPTNREAYGAWFAAAWPWVRTPGVAVVARNVGLRKFLQDLLMYKSGHMERFGGWCGKRTVVRYVAFARLGARVVEYSCYDIMGSSEKKFYVGASTCFQSGESYSPTILLLRHFEVFGKVSSHEGSSDQVGLTTKLHPLSGS
ncbi:hypothetical protein IFM89_037115 [Coptis chinensis]|uniref:Uncharacterized protein n=1 Tax=Coptis chinensis TaxID=261450 RepID=A0A835HPX4_9MAGN|nr:hypothetical protein IFM89_037115 [Coptis chinensis]